MTGVLLERDDELAALTARLDAAQAGHGGLQVIRGPAGIGKTSLLAAADAAAGEREMTVLRARAAPLEQAFAFGIVRQLLDPVRAARTPAEWAALTSGAAALSTRALDAVAPDAAGTQDAMHATLHGLFWLVANLAESRPVLLQVDDLHWSDAASLRWFGHLARRVDGLALAIVVAVRAGEPPSHPLLLDDVLAATPLAPLCPRPLAPEGTGALVRRHLPEATEAFARACHAATGGNPFLLGALSAQLRAEGLAPTDEAVDAINAFGAEPVAEAVKRQLSRLPAGAKDLAEAIAILGPGARLREAALVAELDHPRAMRLADALRAAGLVTGERELELAHPVISASVYAAMPAGERALGHARAARVFQAEQDDLERVAVHLLRTEPAGDAAVVGALQLAAHSAGVRGAPETAAQFLRRALAEPPADARTRAAVMLELGLALAAHRDAGATDLLCQAVEATDDPAARADAGLRGARALGLFGLADEAIDICRHALDQPDPMPSEAVQRLEAELIVNAWTTVQTKPEAHRRLHRRSTRGRSLDLWRVNAAFEATLAGRPAQVSLALLRPALHSGAIAAEWDSLLSTAAALVMIANDDLDTTRSLCDAVIDAARPRGWLSTVAHGSFLRAVAALRAGAIREAEADARVAFDFKLATSPPNSVAWALAPLVDALVLMDAPDAADAALDGAGIREPRRDALSSPMLLESRARLRLAQGRAREAHTDLRDAAERWSAFSIEHPGLATWRHDAVRALRLLDEHDEAHRLARTQLVLAERVDAPGPVGAALCSLALTASREETIPLLERAVAVLAPSSAQLEHGRALYELGAALRRAGRRTDARAVLLSALDLADRIGAARLAGQARDELRAAGARPRRAALSGPASLTPAEQRIATLAAQERTNREIAQLLFLTTRTVETHLSHVFQKLDIRARTEIAARLHGASAAKGNAPPAGRFEHGRAGVGPPAGQRGDTLHSTF